MLKQLYIQNFTLIDEMNILFHPGFSVITGETGAGKSIILGALGLLKGNRADTKQIRQGEERCVIEAHFDIRQYDLKDFFLENDLDDDPQDCILRREININGKSRAFINDTPASLSVMKDLGERLIDIHSQHQNLLLNKEDFQLHVVDILTKDEDTLRKYQESYQKYKKEQTILEEMIAKVSKDQENEDYLRFQLQELSDAALSEGEQEVLEQEISTLEHAEEIKSALYLSQNLISNESNGIIETLNQVSQQLQKIEQIYTPVQEISQRMESCYIEMKDLLQEITAQGEQVSYNPQQLEQSQARLDTINSLEHKYHVASIAELIAYQQKIQEQINLLDHSDEEIQKQKDIVAKLLDNCTQQAERLTTIRKKAAKTIESEMKARLVPLGIPKINFKVDIKPKELSSNGKDSVSFLFSANTNSPLSPVSQVASGGEIARVMLSLKAMISGAVKLPTIIFDEIDTGVSGSVAEKMAHIMDEMGNNHRQVISITHLPQIAALGKNHYKVSKTETPNGTISNMTPLNEQQRIEEIAQMLSGSNITKAALANARELLNVN
ncbi:DNA repair protein RecN [Hoylesella timonensis]|uniref:DNA repair protein RecN n=2 Tax=Hoylesella timonensis TaxID=386414 RepID=A0A098YRM3_9BACT|nr:DNA repair protein RecN [Hoylesella timonensis]KGI21907.1 DNA recombination protein RecN [Hoylesella timonensis S9-PR14]PMC10886.1 DNA repair protein RecN [Hoylesella timonensis]